MAFGIFGNKEGPLEKLASGKVKTEQEKQQLLAALAQGGGPSAEELVPLVLVDDATIAARAVPMFSARASPEAVGALIAEAVERGAAPLALKVLGKLSADLVSRGVDGLLASASPDSSRRLWELALELPPSVSDGLVERAMAEAPPAVRGIALKRMLKARGAAALKPVLLEAAVSREASLRKEALVALGALDGDDVFQVMLERQSSDDSREIRELVGAWLQRSLARAPPDVRPRVLGKLLLAGGPEQRQALVRGLFTPANVADQLLGVLTFCKSLTGQQHRTVMESLKEVGDLLVAPTISLLSSTDADLRVQAVYLLEAYADPRTLGPLLQVLGDADWWVRIVACEAIGRVKEPRTLSALARLFQDADARYAAIDAVGTIGGAEAAGLLIPLLGDGAAEVRAAAVSALSRVKDARAEPALQEVAARDRSVDVRLKAVEALRGLKGGERSSGAVVSSKELTRPVEKLLAYAREKGASDLHITPGEPPVMRINGTLVRLESQKVEPEASRALLMELVDPVRRPLLEKHGAVDLCYAISGVGRYRANIFKMKRGLAGVFRTIPNLAPTLAELGLPKKLDEIGTYHQGIVLVTGPAGSGKTTTLTALVNIINETRAAHVLTFEDPVEYVHQPRMALINQREIGKDSRSYASAMRGALREDPDVIVVGDMRDPETIRLALLASETGHLVIATMQTTGAAASIDKLVESFPPEEQPQVRVGLSESFKLILSQVLVPRAQGGRVAVYELLTSTSSVRSLIRDGKTFQLASAMTIGRAAGMMTLDGGLEERLRTGDITFETALAFAQNKDAFLKLQGVAGARPAEGTAAPPGRAPSNPPPPGPGDRPGPSAPPPPPRAGAAPPAAARAAATAHGAQPPRPSAPPAGGAARPGGQAPPRPGAAPASRPITGSTPQHVPRGGGKS